MRARSSQSSSTQPASKAFDILKQLVTAKIYMCIHHDPFDALVFLNEFLLIYVHSLSTIVAKSLCEKADIDKIPAVLMQAVKDNQKLVRNDGVPNPILGCHEGLLKLSSKDGAHLFEVVLITKRETVIKDLTRLKSTHNCLVPLPNPNR